jgi:hypothetical protein
MAGDGFGVMFTFGGGLLGDGLILEELSGGGSPVAFLLAALLDVDALTAADGKGQGNADRHANAGLPPGAGDTESGRESS